MKTLEEIEITLKSRNDHLYPIYLNVYDTPLANAWLEALNKNLKSNLHLEKNYCFLGVKGSIRNDRFLSKRLKGVIKTLKEYNSTWESFGLPAFDFDMNLNPQSLTIQGPIGQDLPGGWPNHDTLNMLHRWFEELQGTDVDPSEYYINSDYLTKYSIRQINLLCHEIESWGNSYRQSIAAPEWQRPSQLMCWINSNRFTLTDEHLNEFGLDTLDRTLGGIHLGVNKTVGKTHYEVYTDESGEDIDNLTTIAMRAQTIGSGDFDIEWGQNLKGRPFHDNSVAGFKEWLINNNLDPDEPKLTIGHPKVGQVNLEKSFGNSTSIDIVWPVIMSHMDVYSVKTSDEEAIYTYNWSDYDFVIRQMRELLPQYDNINRGRV